MITYVVLSDKKYESLKNNTPENFKYREIRKIDKNTVLMVELEDSIYFDKDNLWLLKSLYYSLKRNNGDCFKIKLELV